MRTSLIIIENYSLLFSETMNHLEIENVPWRHFPIVLIYFQNFRWLLTNGDERREFIFFAWRALFQTKRHFLWEWDEVIINQISFLTSFFNHELLINKQMFSIVLNSSDLIQRFLFVSNEVKIGMILLEILAYWIFVMSLHLNHPMARGIRGPDNRLSIIYRVFQ